MLHASFSGFYLRNKLLRPVLYVSKYFRVEFVDDCVDSEDVPYCFVQLVHVTECSVVEAMGYRNGVLSGSRVNNLGCLHTLC